MGRGWAEQSLGGYEKEELGNGQDIFEADLRFSLAHVYDPANKHRVCMPNSRRTA